MKLISGVGDWAKKFLPTPQMISHDYLSFTHTYTSPDTYAKDVGPGPFPLSIFQVLGSGPDTCQHTLSSF